MGEQSSWAEITAEDPGHSARYVERFRSLAAEGADLAGEARLAHAMAPPRGRILDAGCGPGRVGAELHRLGHEVVGVDLDPVLIAAAEQDHPGPTWVLGDLAALDLAAGGIPEGFDLVVCAGNVLTFVPVTDRRAVLAGLRGQLRGDGRIVAGFGAGRGYAFDEFRADTRAVGLATDLELATWDLRPFTPDADFLVSVLSRG